MNSFMTNATQSNYIEWVSFIISMPMMIFVCLIVTIVETSLCAGFSHFTLLDRCTNFIAHIAFNILLLFAVTAVTHVCFTFRSFTILAGTFIDLLSAFWRFVILGYCKVIALFAPRTQSIFAMSVSGKIRRILGSLASRTIFVYDGFRHNQFLFNWLSLEPVAGHIPAPVRFILPPQLSLSRGIL